MKCKKIRKPYNFLPIPTIKYSTAHFKLDDTRVQQLHDSTRFQKFLQHFPRAHDRPMTYYHWKLHACMHETFVLLACVARTACDVHFVGVCSLNCTRASTRAYYARVQSSVHEKNTHALTVCTNCTCAFRHVYDSQDLRTIRCTQ